MEPKPKIHFICRGNVHRSRIAEAYARSKMETKWDISSSGIDADDSYPSYFLSPWARIIGHKNSFGRWFSSTTTQTSSDVLRDKDIIVFMNVDVYQDAKKRYDFDDLKCLVWKVKDREDWNENLKLSEKRRRTFRLIKRHVDQLIHDIEHGGWVDIVDSTNKSLDFSLPINIANHNGAWHRTCHAIITTPKNHTLVEKRSKQIIFSPKLIDVTMGGHVDRGEAPDDAIIREIKEELGLNINPNSMQLMDIFKWSSFHPHYKKYSKAFVYTYHVKLSDNNPAITLQREEVQKVNLLSPAKLRRLLKTRRLTHLGKLNYSHVYYSKIANQAGVI